MHRSPADLKGDLPLVRGVPHRRLSVRELLHFIWALLPWISSSPDPCLQHSQLILFLSHSHPTHRHRQALAAMADEVSLQIAHYR